ncbi:RNA binding protein (contains ribosomal protein S1 domain) [Legionella donaldsonii]|uniref:RNA binding protein (Contains ribosomal protein S1 domain) n=1 Tax=Legionella donaldsonii TaxID=45060 RepID=A0A378J0Z9_9GAMM|nr:hypothetical protein [Legionella donaldsonii]STX41199.1 RNA binding protein (contains ribosomal protein S1 domain) [Legionella donaldsonii]
MLKKQAMIILYIPFSRDEAGDLPSGAALWKTNHRVSSQERLKVIYHQDDYSPDLISPESKVYILAHGYEEKPTVVANCAEASQAIFLDMETVTKRFEYDLLVIAPFITTVHTYFCGSQKNNYERASTFQTQWLRSEQAPIHYYAGNLATPDRNGFFWAQSNSEYVPLTRCCHTLNPTSIEEEGPKRRNIKMEKISAMFAHHYEKKRESFFTQTKENRQDLIALYRNSDESIPVLPENCSL